MLFFLQPLEQFEIALFSGLFFYIPINFIYFLFVIFSLFFFFYLPYYKLYLFPLNTWVYFCEFIYIFVFNMLNQQVGLKGQKYFPLLLSIFLFILLSNVLGLTPYGFSITGFMVKTFSLSLSFLIGLTIIGFQKQGLHFLNLFLPKGVPVFLIPLIVAIEILSYIIKPISLGIRLFANIMAGHSLLNILSGFTFILFKKNFFFGIVPFLIVLLISFLEVGVAFLQAYVFVILLCMYLNDSFLVEH